MMNATYFASTVVCHTNCSYSLSGNHYIGCSRNGEVMESVNWQTSLYSYRASISASMTPGECYYSNGDAMYLYLAGDSLMNVDVSPPYILGTNNSSFQSNTVCRPNPTPAPIEPGSPIVLNLSNGGYDLTGVDDPVAFDLDRDGVRERIGWTAASANEAFLCLDRNANGTIDDGGELFGNHTVLASGAVATNGFLALAELDSDRNGHIDHADAAWPQLELWTDANHDGISQEAELKSLSASAVQSISTDARWSGRRDAYGNTFRYRADIT
ncbi:MAG: hypothetical protein M3Q69_12305, partial [Acidobacteriota bacterium]|nr:hypothetical protein [Acidobacteriota bacterium]